MKPTVNVKKEDYADKDSLDAFLAGVAKATAAINEDLDNNGLPLADPVVIVAGRIIPTPLSTGA